MVNIGDRVALIPHGKFPREWIGQRATIVEGPAIEEYLAKSGAVWLRVDGEDTTRHFWPSEFRVLSLPELIGELPNHRPR